jgi:hypothetical protein
MGIKKTRRLNPKILQMSSQPSSGVQCEIRYFRSRDIGRVRKGRTGLNNGVRISRVLQAPDRYSVRMFVIKEILEKGQKI